MAGEYRVVPFDVVTGRRLMPHITPLVSDYSATASITTEGQGSFTVYPRDERFSEIDQDAWERMCLGWGTGIALEWVTDAAFSRRSGTVVYAGLIQDVQDDWDTGATIINTKEVSVLLALRLLWGIGTLGEGHRVLKGNSLYDIMCQVVWHAMVKNPGRWGLRIDLPPHQTNGRLVRTQYRYNFQPASSIMQQLNEEDGAPDYYFRPYWAGDGGMAWRMEFGVPAFNDLVSELTVSQPQGASKYGQHYQPTKSPVINLSRKTDYALQRTGIFTLGTGSEEDMRYGEAGGRHVAINTTIPFLDSVQSYKNVDSTGQLNALSRQALEESRNGVEQISFGVVIEDLPKPMVGQVQPGQIKPGKLVKLTIPGDGKRWRKRTLRQVVLSTTFTSSEPHVVAIESQQARD